MQYNDFLDDFITIMANCDNEEEGKNVYLNYISGKKTITMQDAENIVREIMEDKIREDKFNEDDDLFGEIAIDAHIDYFMSYSNLRFLCGMSKNEFRSMLDRVANDMRNKYF